MITLKELESWFDDIWNIIVDLYISINNARRLTESKYEYEDKIKKHGFLQHHWYQAKFIIVIQLAKLFTDNKNSQKRNLHKLCNCLENESYDDDIMQQLNKNSKTPFSKVFKSKDDILEAINVTRNDLSENAVLIKKITSARDQIYAHKDPNPEVIAISMSELETLINLSDIIINRLRGHLFSVHTDFKKTSDWDIDYVLKGLSENFKTKRAKFEDLRRN